MTGENATKTGTVMLTVSFILIVIAMLNNEFELYYPLGGLQLMITKRRVVISITFLGSEPDSFGSMACFVVL